MSGCRRVSNSISAGILRDRSATLLLVFYCCSILGWSYLSIVSLIHNSLIYQCNVLLGNTFTFSFIRLILNVYLFCILAIANFKYLICKDVVFDLSFYVYLRYNKTKITISFVRHIFSKKIYETNPCFAEIDLSNLSLYITWHSILLSINFKKNLRNCNENYFPLYHR